jgi:hypothetical protein
MIPKLPVWWSKSLREKYDDILRQQNRIREEHLALQKRLVQGENIPEVTSLLELETSFQKYERERLKILEQSPSLFELMQQWLVKRQ